VKSVVATVDRDEVVNGETVKLRAGVTRLSADHPLVRAKPELFKSASRRPAVEAATAAPGEKRGDV